MKTELVAKRIEERVDEAVACCACDRRMKNPAEWISSRNRVICVACYESLLNPFAKSCGSGAAV
jgi:hypothetical protein